LWAIITILKEIDYKAYSRIEQQALLERIMLAVTWTELAEAILLLPEILSVREKEQHLSLQVRRAKSIIYECYQKGITLDEIAEQLGITPEYLSTQFHKEVGLTYNTFIKNHRMKKAKELLIGTDKKLYEIAAAVGYADPKYFSRVFRDTTGQLPAEFRKVHK
jgi:two-component system response regulator YesN